MIKVENIRRIDMLNIGPIFKLNLSYIDGTSEDMGFLTFTEEGKIKLEALKEFIEVNKLEEKCFLISK